MHVVVRADASVDIGWGHVMRCMALADTLRLLGAECTFVARALTRTLVERLTSHGHALITIPAHAGGDGDEQGTAWEVDSAHTLRALSGQTVDWLVVDHYALDRPWEQAMRAHGPRVLAIDDLANRAHSCDVLLDQNLGRAHAHYADHVPAQVPLLLGPEYALLRPEFAVGREASIRRRADASLGRVLIALGGVDKDNATERVLNALDASALPHSIQVTVVMGSQAPWLQQVQARAKHMQARTRVLVDVADMAALMSDSDLAIGAAGVSAWERCCLGLPSLLLIQAENQRPGAMALQAAGAAFVMDGALDIQDFFRSHADPADMSGQLKAMSHAAYGVTDGRGAQRVAQYMVDHV